MENTYIPELLGKSCNLFVLNTLCLKTNLSSGLSYNYVTFFFDNIKVFNVTRLILFVCLCLIKDKNSNILPEILYRLKRFLKSLNLSKKIHKHVFLEYDKKCRL